MTRGVTLKPRTPKERVAYYEGYLAGLRVPEGARGWALPSAEVLLADARTAVDKAGDAGEQPVDAPPTT